MTTFIVNQAFLIVIRYGIEGNKGWWADNLDMGGVITYVMEGDRWNRTSHHIIWLFILVLTVIVRIIIHSFGSFYNILLFP